MSRGEDGLEFTLNGNFYEVTFFDLNMVRCPLVNDDNTPLRIAPGQWFFLKYTVKHKYRNQLYFVELSIYSASNPNFLFYAGNLDTRLCPDNSVTSANHSPKSRASAPSAPTPRTSSPSSTTSSSSTSAADWRK